MKLSLSTKLKFHQYYNYLEKGNELLSSLMFLGVKHPAFAVVGLTANILKVVFKHTNINSWDLVDTWYCPSYSYKVHTFLSSILSSRSVFRDKENGIEVFNIDGINIVKYDHNVYFENETAEKEVLKKIFSINKHIQLITREKYFDIIPLPKKNILKSKRAEDLYKRLNSSLKKGRFRSLLLYGNPGSGKTSIAQYIADNYVNEYGGKILHINLKDFEEFNATDIQMFLDFIKPEVVLIDDIDQFNDPDSLLKLFETNKERHNLVIATSNSMLSLAARRPERFDEAKEINDLPPEAFDNHLKELSNIIGEEQKEQLLQWPISYVNELNIRREDLEDFKLEEEIKDLRERLDIEEIELKSKSRKRKKKILNDE